MVYSVAPEDAGVVEEVSQLEGILARTQGSNALIVAALGSGEMDTVYGLVGHIQSHQAPEVLRDKQIYQLEAGALIDAAHGDKSTFESAFNAVMDEAAAAGNVIVLFDDLPGFLENAHHIGSDAAALLYRYLSMPGVQIIALADKRRFGEGVEQNAMLMEGFEIVRTHEKDERALIGILQNEVLRVEAASKVFFTYQAVAAVVTSAERYFTEGEPLDKAKDLLEELPAAAPVNRIITKDTVLTFVEKKTGVPQEGTLEAGERDKLLTLEKTLHERVVGQDEAIDAIANTMRRARAGLRNENRPMGSFLFLGPTGVGKTETAKALQDIFFGAETPMLRLDMSEYTGPDALERLTGSFASGKQGVLVEMLRAQQYGVLLLDEFEKASSEVHNLFLQVLDEGFFSDMAGKKVNARNVIVIATSNAGSDTIFALTEAGKDLAAAKNEFIDGLVKSGIFRPELINRFDGAILFHPLGETQIAQIATLTAKKLAATLKAQGLELVINNDLTNYLAREGFDRQFGARAMNRVLQEKVEKLLATELIGGAIAKGSRIEFIQAPDPHELSLRVAA